MSVVLEKDKIVITIPSMCPASQLKEMQSDLIFTIQNFDTQHMSHNFYQILTLLESMLPDKNTFENLHSDFKFDTKHLKQTISEFSPNAMLCYLLQAQTFLYRYATKETEKNVCLEIEDTISHIKAIAEAIEKGVQK